MSKLKTLELSEPKIKEMRLPEVAQSAELKPLDSQNKKRSVKYG